MKPTPFALALARAAVPEYVEMTVEVLDIDIDVDAILGALDRATAQPATADFQVAEDPTNVADMTDLASEMSTPEPIRMTALPPPVPITARELETRVRRALTDLGLGMRADSVFAKARSYPFTKARPR